MSEVDENNFPLSELTYKIIGSAMSVHRFYGPWYVEYVYQKGLEHVLRKDGLNFIAKEEVPIYYEDELTGATLKPDFIVENKIIVEIKALEKLTRKSEKQVLSYMRATKKEVGLLINFGTEHLEWKRFAVTKKDDGK